MTVGIIQKMFKFSGSFKRNSNTNLAVNVLVNQILLQRNSLHVENKVREPVVSERLKQFDSRYKSCQVHHGHVRKANQPLAMHSKRHFTSTAAAKSSESEYIYTECEETKVILKSDMKVIVNFISEEEEERLHKEIEPHVKRLRYESSHWDDAIHGYRETQRGNWTEKNQEIIQRIRDLAFPPGVTQLSLVHVLDLKKDGYIKPHVDAVKFCGNTIAGLSLLSSAVMRLVHTDDSSKTADILLERRSLYIMKGEARYKFTHEILKEEESVFNGRPVPRDRRISVMCRNEP